jgi:hypothetical protein
MCWDATGYRKAPLSLSLCVLASDRTGLAGRLAGGRDRGRKTGGPAQRNRPVQQRGGGGACQWCQWGVRIAHDAQLDAVTFRFPTAPVERSHPTGAHSFISKVDLSSCRRDLRSQFWQYWLSLSFTRSTNRSVGSLLRWTTRACTVRRCVRAPKLSRHTGDKARQPGGLRSLRCVALSCAALRPPVGGVQPLLDESCM